MSAANSTPVDLTESAVNSGRELVSTMLLPTIGRVRAQSEATADNLTVGCIVQLGAVLVAHHGPKRAEALLLAIAKACGQYGGH